MTTGPQRRFGAALLGAFVAAFVALTTTALGGSGTGSTFNLGRSNSVSKQTVLTGSAGRAAQLKVRNRGRGPALEAVVRRGVPPFRVNSSGRVANLNADLLDGIHASGFYRAGSKVADANELDGVDGAAYQRRVSGTCAAGSALRVVAADGTVTCQGFWSSAGNAGTAPATSFLGTTDAQALVFRTNNAEAMRVDTAGNLGVGTTVPAARVEANSVASGSIAVMGTATETITGISTARAVIGRLGAISCPGNYGVGGCAGESGGIGVQGSSSSSFGVHGTSSSGIGVHGGSDTNRAVEGLSGTGIGVIGDSTTRGVVGTLGGTSCAGTFAVGGCGSTVGNGVFGDSSGGIGVWGRSTARGVVGTLDATSCPGQYAVGGCSGTAVAVGVFGRSITNTGVMASTDTGNIFLGVTGAAETPQARIDNTGKGFFNGGTQTGGADYAESLRASGNAALLEPGDVLALDPRGGPAVRKSRQAYSTRVAGVYSTKPALLAVGEHRINEKLVGEVPVALLGVVPTKVSAENGRIRVGDLLTTARTAGHAMKAKPIVVRGVKIYPTGAILGKALQPLRKGKSTIKVLVMLR
jgi:hypothetical protein